MNALQEMPTLTQGWPVPRPALRLAVAFAPPASLSGPSSLGTAVAEDALTHATHAGGSSLEHIGAVLLRHGISCEAASQPFEVAEVLARCPKLKEVQVAAADLKSLAAGALLVWQRSANMPHGHVSISLGDGREWSGRVRRLLNLGTPCRVFLPQ